MTSKAQIARAHSSPQEVVAEVAGSIIGAFVQPEQSLSELGLSSPQALQLSNQLSRSVHLQSVTLRASRASRAHVTRRFAVALPSTIAYQCSTVRALARRVVAATTAETPLTPKPRTHNLPTVPFPFFSVNGGARGHGESFR